MRWVRKEIELEARPRGFHLVTGEIEAALPELREARTGLAHLFLLHTSASLAVNENADPSVRADFERHMRRLVPDAAAHFEHTAEGPDDMSAHVKGALFGPGLTLPVERGRFALGTWQGIYLGEHRERGGRRRVLVTLLAD